MGEEFYCILKLVSGEEIFSLIVIDENDGDRVIVLQNPVIIKIINNNHGSFIKVKPWIETSNEDFFIIKEDKIITMTECSDDKLIELYNNYIADSNEGIVSTNITTENEVKISNTNKMGYVAGVEESRRILEDIFKNSQ